eukprot:Skav212024  [mRNA]  locus=scaffold984:222705:223166:- [translate_table: standard]
MSEVLCHDLATSLQADLFSEEARLINKGTPSKALKATILKAFGMQPDASIYSSSQAMLKPAGVCTKGDMACLHGSIGQRFQACHVWIHVEVDSIVYSLVSVWDLLELDSTGCFATMKKKDGAQFVLTSSLACTTAYMHYQNDMFKVIVPLQMK